MSREKALENREQIIETAARLLREHGFNGIGVADIMKAAGLTHGGFDRNFASKDDLAVKASERAIADTTALLKECKGHSGLRIRFANSSNAMCHRPIATIQVPGAFCRRWPRTPRGATIPLSARSSSRRFNPISTRLRNCRPRHQGRAGSRHPAAILSEMVGAVILSRVIANHPLAELLIAAVVTDIAGPSPENKSAEG